MLGAGRINQRHIIEFLDWELIYIDRQLFERQTTGRRDSKLGRSTRRADSGGGCGGGGSEPKPLRRIQ